MTGSKSGKSDSFGGNFKIRIILAFGFIGMMVVIYRNSLYLVISAVAERHDSSHGVFVPLISAYLFWLNWDNIKASDFRPANLIGLATICLGLLFLFGSYPEGCYKLAALSFFVLTAGLVILLLGMEIIKQVWFPFLFLITMIPLPEQFYNNVADLIRIMTTWGSVSILKILNVPHHLDGFNLHLKDQHLIIAHACSGIRYFLSYLVFGTAYAFRFKTSNHTRLATVAAAVPMAVLGGILRLSTIFLTTHYIGPIFVTGKPHVLLSWSVFTLVLVAAVWIDQVISRKRGHA